MRALTWAALAGAAFAAAAPAQEPADPVRPAPAAAQIDGRLRAEIALLKRIPGYGALPPADSFRIGGLEIGPDVEHSGTAATAHGNLDVRGRVQGDAVALHGDVIVHPGGHVTGNAVAIDGRVRAAGGVIEGDVRSVRGIAAGLLARAAGRDEVREPVTTWTALKMVLGWFALLCAIGFGVLLFAERNLDGVVSALERRFARAFWVGVLAQLAALPALLVIILGLAVTLIGILLIPFAVVAYIVALAGMLALGFLAVARFTGGAFGGQGLPTRRLNLRAMLIGVALYTGLWFLAAAFVWNPVAGTVLRGIALAGTWVALTLGLGATILTWAGTRRPSAAERSAAGAGSDVSWQTPTPVTGVAAARRPVAAARERS